MFDDEDNNNIPDISKQDEMHFWNSGCFVVTTIVFMNSKHVLFLLYNQQYYI